MVRFSRLLPLIFKFPSDASEHSEHSGLRVYLAARNIGIYRAGAGSAFANIGIYRAGAGSAFANIATYRAGVVSAHTGLLETSVFIARAPFRPSQMSLFIDRASFRSTSPCSEHQYLSSGCWSDLRKRRYLSIRRHFGPSKPCFLSNVRRFSPNRLARPSIAHRFVHIALVETSVLIECTPVRPSQMSVSIDQAHRLARNVGLTSGRRFSPNRLARPSPERVRKLRSRCPLDFAGLDPSDPCSSFCCSNFSLCMDMHGLTLVYIRHRAAGTHGVSELSYLP